MTITLEKVRAALRYEDIEGFIQYSGAPDDEYDDEAAEIYAFISAMDFEKLNEDGILEIIISVWKKSFNLDDADINKRSIYSRKAVVAIIS